MGELSKEAALRELNAAYPPARSHQPRPQKRSTRQDISPKTRQTRPRPSQPILPPTGRTFLLPDGTQAPLPARSGAIPPSRRSQVTKHSQTMENSNPLRTIFSKTLNRMVAQKPAAKPSDRMKRPTRSKPVEKTNLFDLWAHRTNPNGPKPKRRSPPRKPKSSPPSPAPQKTEKSQKSLQARKEKVSPPADALPPPCRCLHAWDMATGGWKKCVPADTCNGSRCTKL